MLELPETGVCLANQWPGATNLVTGIATAYMDSIPVVAITGNVPNDLLGRDSFQEVNIAESRCQSQSIILSYKMLKIWCICRKKSICNCQFRKKRTGLD